VYGKRPQMDYTLFVFAGKLSLAQRSDVAHYAQPTYTHAKPQPKLCSHVGHIIISPLCCQGKFEKEYKQVEGEMTFSIRFF
jgi:hypothetical protein